MGVFLTTGLVVVGFSGGSIERIPANHLLVKNVSAIGVYLGGYLKNKPRVVDEVGMGVWMEGSVGESCVSCTRRGICTVMCTSGLD